MSSAGKDSSKFDFNSSKNITNILSVGEDSSIVGSNLSENITNICSNAEVTTVQPNLSKNVFNFEERFHHLSETGIMSDCEFIVGAQNVVVKGHKLIFAAASEIFLEMFYGKLKEENHVKIEDLDPDGFIGMKKFIYTNETTFKSAIHALFIFLAARKYLIPKLRDECIQYIKNNIQPTEVLKFHELCKINEILEFDEVCIKIIREKTNEVIESEHFLSAKMETIELILSSPTLQLGSEIDVFDLFKRWAHAEADRQELELEDYGSHFNTLKKHIRFLTIEGDEFVTRVAESLFLTPKEKLAIGLNKIKSDPSSLPENLCMSTQKRDFNPSESATYRKFSNKFLVPFNSKSVTDCNWDFYFMKRKWRVVFFRFTDYVCLTVQTEKIDGNLLLRIESNLKVLGTGIQGTDDFTTGNNSNYAYINEDGRNNLKNINQFDMVVAVVPRTELGIRQNKEGSVVIEGSFTFQAIK